MAAARRPCSPRIRPARRHRPCRSGNRAAQHLVCADMSGGVAVQALVVGLSVGAIYGLVGLGFSLLWSLTRVLAFAHGDIVIGSVLFAVLAIIGTTPVALSPDVLHSLGLIILSLLFGVALSVASYVVAVRPFLGRTHRAEDLMGW